MGIKEKESKEKTERRYEVEVTKAHEFKSGDIGFDMVVNGINIYGCVYLNENPEKNIKDPFISFPSRKGSDGKYYNHVYFKITDELFSEIEKGIEAVL